MGRRRGEKKMGRGGGGGEKPGRRRSHVLLEVQSDLVIHLLFRTLTDKNNNHTKEFLAHLSRRLK